MFQVTSKNKVLFLKDIAIQLSDEDYVAQIGDTISEIINEIKISDDKKLDKKLKKYVLNEFMTFRDIEPDELDKELNNLFNKLINVFEIHGVDNSENKAVKMITMIFSIFNLDEVYFSLKKDKIISPTKKEILDNFSLMRGQ